MEHLCSLNIMKIILTANDHLTYAPHVHILPQVDLLLWNTINYQIPGRPNCQQMINHAYSYSNAHAPKLSSIYIN